MTILRRTLDASPASPAVAGGVLLLRVVTGGLVFYLHGWHKMLQGWAYLHDGTPWPLITEIADMRISAPVAFAFGATFIQLLCGLLLALGLGTRFAAFALTMVLAGAIAQNLAAGRDPQLAILYTLNAAGFVLIGGGRFSCDAKLAGKR
jgi:putative oxidoreductase